MLVADPRVSFGWRHVPALRVQTATRFGAGLLWLLFVLGCGGGDDELNTSDDDDTLSSDDDDAFPGDDDDTLSSDDDDDVPGDDDDAGDDDDTAPPSSLTAEPGELAFGVVAAFGQYAANLELVVEGDSEVTLTDVVLSGTAAENFTVDDVDNTVIAAGAVLVVEVVYTPTDAATHHAEIFVYSDADPSFLSILLSGTAQVDLADVDNDGDGVTENQGDCDDADETRFPGAPELCNDIDDDCDGVVPADESHDGDGDGAVECADCDDTDPAMNLQDNDFDAWSTCAGDCDDTTSTVRPGATESCNGVDDDCDGVLEPEELTDSDGDGWLACEDCDDLDLAMNFDDADGDRASSCHGDCDDHDPNVYPAAIDTPGDGFDANCDGID